MKIGIIIGASVCGAAILGIGIYHIIKRFKKKKEPSTDDSEVEPNYIPSNEVMDARESPTYVEPEDEYGKYEKIANAYIPEHDSGAAKIPYGSVYKGVEAAKDEYTDYIYRENSDDTPSEEIKASEEELYHALESSQDLLFALRQDMEEAQAANEYPEDDEPYDDDFETDEKFDPYDDPSLWWYDAEEDQWHHDTGSRMPGHEDDTYTEYMEWLNRELEGCERLEAQLRRNEILKDYDPDDSEYHNGHSLNEMGALYRPSELSEDEIDALLKPRNSGDMNNPFVEIIDEDDYNNTAYMQHEWTPLYFDYYCKDGMMIGEDDEPVDSTFNTLGASIVSYLDSNPEKWIYLKDRDTLTLYEIHTHDAVWEDPYNG